MKRFKYIYGPVPSRRMGNSIGVSPLPRKTCNYSCIYCQLGRTNNMINDRREFFPIDDIISEINDYIDKKINYDVITIVGEGEPTLYSKLGYLIKKIKEKTPKPVAVITNGALLYDKSVKEDLYNADIVLPSIDAFDQESFKKINRPYKSLNFEKVKNGIIDFSQKFKGLVWLEIMLIKCYNDDEASLNKVKLLLNKIKYDKLYINTPIRPPSEKNVETISNEAMDKAVKILKGVSIDRLVSSGFYSQIKDHSQAIISIISRHPMNQHEITSFLKSRTCEDIEKVFKKLKNNSIVNIIDYKGYKTYRIKT